MLTLFISVNLMVNVYLISWHNGHVNLVAITGTTIRVPYHTVDVAATHMNIGCRDFIYRSYLDGVVQDCSNSIANAMELLQSCTKPLIFKWVAVTLMKW